MWAWREPVSVECAACQGCSEIYLRVNGNRIRLESHDGELSALVRLREGMNRVVAVCRGAGGEDHESRELRYRERLEDRPKSLIHMSLQEGGVVLDGAHSRPSEASGARIVGYEWSARTSNPAPLTVRSGAAERELGPAVTAPRVVVAPPRSDGEYYVSLRVTDQNGRQDSGSSYFVVQGGNPRLPDQDTENPAWVDTAVVYGVIPFLFGEQPLRAVTAKLDYLGDLGVNALWLSPINTCPPGDFGYAVTDYFDIRPDYGTKADFRELVRRAHSLGIRVLMDLVPNHTSDQHPYFKDAQAHGKASHYYDFYDRDRDGRPTHYFDWTNLPNLNYDNPEVRRFITEAFSFWVREFDVDGFRVDAAWGVKERRPDFWPVWRRELKRIKPDLLLLAEASARDPYYFAHGFDAAYDWTDNLGEWAWHGVFDHEATLGYALNVALTNGGAGYDRDALIFRFLNNNDTGSRFVSVYGVGMTRVAAAMLLTLPGIPCVYTGDEVGAEYLPYETTSAIEWNDRHGLREYYRKLIRLRRSTPSLHSRSWQPLHSEPGGQTYAYVRYVAPSRQPVLVVLNYGPSADVRVRIPEEFAVFAGSRAPLDMLADERLTVRRDNPVTVPMRAWTARILAPVT